jgi:hypothetical protein
MPGHLRDHSYMSKTGCVSHLSKALAHLCILSDRSSSLPPEDMNEACDPGVPRVPVTVAPKGSGWSGGRLASAQFIDC